MKKQYSIPEIIAGIINVITPLIIITNVFFECIPYDNYRYGLLVGIWIGWCETRNYYKKKMQSNAQDERKEEDVKDAKKEQTECKSECSINSPQQILNTTISEILTIDDKHIAS